MSEDEVFVLLGACVAAFFFWSKWIRDILFIYDRRGQYAGVMAVVAPAVAMLMLFCVLIMFSSLDVKSSPLYITFYIALGLAWCGAVTKVFSFLGLDYRHDVAEQDNYAADIAIGGAVVGSMLCFAGGNIGNGPGWWVVVWCACLANGALLLLWIVSDQVSGICESITVDRDLAAGIRFAGLMVSSGLVLGRSVAGDWVSIEVTLADFTRMAVPVLLLMIVALVIDYMTRLSKEIPRQNPVIAGLLPALLYCVLAIGYVLSLGKW